MLSPSRLRLSLPISLSPSLFFSLFFCHCHVITSSGRVGGRACVRPSCAMRCDATRRERGEEPDNIDELQMLTRLQWVPVCLSFCLSVRRSVSFHGVRDSLRPRSPLRGPNRPPASRRRTPGRRGWGGGGGACVLRVVRVICTLSARDLCMKATFRLARWLGGRAPPATPQSTRPS